MIDKNRTTGFRTFLIIWFGQLVSLTGSGLTSFAVGVWVFLRTGSTTAYALILAFTSIPSLVVGPFAGALVDRWDRRKAMLLSDAGAAACTLLILLLLTSDRLQIWHLYLLLTISHSFATFQWPAYSAATALLVPKAQLARANGLVQIAEAVSQILAPVTAGILIETIRLQGVIGIDLSTFVVAVITLMIVRVPRPEKSAEGQAGKGSLFKEAFYGWRYIRERKGLFALLMYFGVGNFLTSIAIVIFTPLILTISTPLTLGVLTSVAGLGFLFGSVLISVWGGPKQKIIGIYVADLIIAAALLLLGSTTNLVVLSAGAFIAFFGKPIVNTCSQTIWQHKTAPDIQGRVFAFRRVIAFSTMPFAYALAGPLADKVFTPLLLEGGALAGSIGRIIGTGPGRGLGLFYLILGLLNFLVTFIGYSYLPLRNVETQLPDMLPDTQPQDIS
jgi:MFS family permease